jgi:hypothetical protein
VKSLGIFGHLGVAEVAGSVPEVSQRGCETRQSASTSIPVGQEQFCHPSHCVHVAKATENVDVDELGVDGESKVAGVTLDELPAGLRYALRMGEVAAVDLVVSGCEPVFGRTQHFFFDLHHGIHRLGCGVS